MFIPPSILQALGRADASWQPVLIEGLHAMIAATPDYFANLDFYLPTDQRLFAAFSQPLDKVRYVLIGEGPYPRVESATGVCFMDGAVNSLWSDEKGGGLSKAVNKATSLRNFMKMLLVAEGRLAPDDTGSTALAAIAAESRDVEGVTQTLPQIQQKLTDEGFLLLNASLVFRETVAPAKDAKAWMPFLQTVLRALHERQPTLVLWGKIAEQLNKLDEAQALPQIAAEHPYNLSFITNGNMQEFFKPMQLLRC